MWGVWDTKDKVWLGDDKGPKVFADFTIARIAAQIVDERLAQPPGRTEAKLYLTPATKIRDTVAPRYSTEEALERILGEKDSK